MAEVPLPRTQDNSMRFGSRKDVAPNLQCWLERDIGRLGHAAALFHILE